MKNELRTKKIEKRRMFQQLSGSGMNNPSIKCNVNQNFQIFKSILFTKLISILWFN